MAAPDRKTGENGFDRPHRFSLDTPVLSTGRLVLRMPNRDDVDDLAKLANNPEIALMTSRLPFPYTVADADDFITRFEEDKLEGYVYAVTLADTGRLIGMCSCEMRARSNGLEVGYWIGRNWWGHGYATEAAAAVVNLAFKVTGTDVVYATCRRENSASRSVLGKVGFRFIGLDEADTVNSGRVTVERYGLTREKWIEIKAK